MIALALLLALAMGVARPAAAKAKPHVIFVVADECVDSLTACSCAVHAIVCCHGANSCGCGCSCVCVCVCVGARVRVCVCLPPGAAATLRQQWKHAPHSNARAPWPPSAPPACPIPSFGFNDIALRDGETTNEGVPLTPTLNRLAEEGVLLDNYCK